MVSLWKKHFYSQRLSFQQPSDWPWVVKVCLCSSLLVSSFWRRVHWDRHLVTYSLIVAGWPPTFLLTAAAWLVQIAAVLSWPARADRLGSTASRLLPPASALTSNYIFIRHKWLPLCWPFQLLLFVLPFTFRFQTFSNSILSLDFF